MSAPRRLPRWIYLPLAAACAACVPETVIEWRYTGFNDYLRRDRLPPTAEQIEIHSAHVAATAYFGPYRIAPAAVTSVLVPDRGPVEHLPQSDCWWMAQAPAGGGDAVRAHWEATVEWFGDIEETFDPDSLYLGLCRLDNPVTREPIRARGSDLLAEIDCSRLHENQAITWKEGEGLRCTSDASFTTTVLTAVAETGADPLRRCELASFGGERRVLGHGDDFFSGISITDGKETRVTSCTAVDGEVLLPSVATRYEITNGQRVPLRPSLHPVAGGSTLGREMARDAMQNDLRRWATPSTQDSLGERWQESFSTSLRVRKVRLFRYDGATRSHLRQPATAPPLCIEDTDRTPGCRWTCDAAAEADGRLAYDLHDGRSCRAGGTATVAAVTPTYAIDTATDRVLHRPLAWSVVDASAASLWIEFELGSAFEGLALRAEPARTTTGAARVGETTRGAFTVTNIGAHPMRITSVAMDASQGGQPGEFVPQLPYRPEGIPLPIELVDSTGEKGLAMLAQDAESQRWIASYADSEHWRVAPRRDDFVAQHEGTTIESQEGLLLRDDVHARFPVDMATTAGVRSSYGLRTLPFVLMPGDAFEVSVRAAPLAVGERYATVRVQSTSTLDSSQRLDLRVRAEAWGLRGPAISAAPGTLVIHVDGDGASRRRAVMIQNAGDVAGTLGAPKLEGPDGSPPSPDTQLALDDPYGGGTLDAGASQVVHVDFRGDCSRDVVGDWRVEDAELHWTTPDGPIVVPIATSTYCGP